MKSLVAVLLLCLSSVVLAQFDEMSAPDNFLTLRGEFSKKRPCIGQNGLGCEPAPIEGCNSTIWHADSTCSILYLECNNDGFSVTLKSPGHITETYLTWMGAYNLAQPFKSRPERCTKDRMISGVSRFDQYTTLADLPGIDCGTKLEGECTSNVLNMVEFLEMDISNPKIQLLSHTHVEVQCCRKTEPGYAVCVPEEPPRLNCADCTLTQCQLNCLANSFDEYFECAVTCDGDFKLLQCEASVPGSPSARLITGSRPEDNLEVVYPVRSNQGKFEFPYIQFDPIPSCNPLEITVRCTVEVA